MKLERLQPDPDVADIVVKYPSEIIGIVDDGVETVAVDVSSGALPAGARVFCHVPRAWLGGAAGTMHLAAAQEVCDVLPEISPGDRVVLISCGRAPRDGIGLVRSGSLVRFARVQTGDAVQGLVVGILRPL